MDLRNAKKRFPRDLGALDALFAFIGTLHAEWRVQDRDAREIELIAEELFTNFVRHNAGRHDIEIGLERTDNAVRIRLRDEDVDEFDPTRAPEPEPNMPLEERRDGGMGILLVRKLADDVSYDYENRTSTVTVVKRLRVRN